MSARSGERGIRSTVWSILAALFVLSTPPGHAQPGGSGPFAVFVGSWSGTGKVTLAGGAVERVRCRVSYTLQAEDAIQQTMRCASDSYKFDLQTEARQKGGVVSGRWTEVTRSASGLMTGRVADGELRASVKHPGFTADITLIARGDKQSITIRSGGHEPVTVAITLSRAQ